MRAREGRRAARKVSRQESAVAATPHPASAKTAAAAIDPLDLYDVRGMLSEEERLVQDAVARLVDAEVLPVIRKAFEEHRFPDRKSVV